MKLVEVARQIVITDVDVLSPRLGESLMFAVRYARRQSLEPDLVLSRSDFERLIDYWPRFYLEGPVVKTRDKDIWFWLRRFFARKRRMPPLLSLSLNDEMLESFKERMLEKQAIPIDGVWVPVDILGE